MAELMARSGNNLQVLTKGQAITGTIKKLTPEEILMDIGGKGDALVIEFDRQNLENLLSILKVGDKVTATVISPESEEGFPVLSLRRMLDDVIFKKFEDLSKSDKPFEVTLGEATRGGYFAETSEGVRGFLPSSQLLDTTDMTGKKIEVKIIELDRSKKRVVFSQKAVSMLMNIDELKKLFKTGDRVTAVVVNVTPYGLFVSVAKDGNTAEGFIHISEIAYERVENLASKFNVGDKLDVEVVEVDASNKRVNLSVKRTQKDKFAEVEEKYKPETKVKGRVIETKTRGVTVELEEGVNGFIPADKIPSGTTYEAGQMVNAEVVEIDRRRRLVVVSPVLKAVPIGYR